MSGTDGRDFVTVVSGVPRSGTSLLMRMLAAGGMRLLSDGARAPDTDNPRGYYELEAVKRLGEEGAAAEWLPGAPGAAVKIIHLLLPHLPVGAGAPAFRVLLLERDPAEVVASQSAMLARSGGGPADALSDARLAEIFAAQLRETQACLDAAGIAWLPVRHADLLGDTAAACQRVDAFLGGGLDRAAMTAAVEPALYRQRAEPGYTGSAMADAEHQIGTLRFSVDHRSPGPEGGPTLRVHAGEREVLRFDCFAKGGHWHLDPAGKDEIQAVPKAVDALDWTVAELRRDAAGYLARAGAAAPAEAELAAALNAIELALRNPEPDLNGLDEAVLRQRRGEKWQQYPDDVLALWVADMDFPVAEPIRRRLQRALDVSDLGYPLHPQPTGLPELFAERAERLYGWKLEPRKVELLTEVVQGMYVALQQFTEEGDGVVIQTPIYPPFLGAVREMKRRVVENPLPEGEGGYRVDIGGLRQQADERTRMLMLCNPHNPTGRVMTREELEGLAEIALERDWIVVSDEIHSDLVHEGHRHIPFATLSPEIAERTITLTSASKAFNIAGLRCAVAAFGGSDLRRRFIAFPRHLRGGLGSLGIEATREAWTHAEPWLESVRAQLGANRDFVAEFVRTELPGVRHHSPQATYLAWLDCRELGLEPSPYQFFLNEAKVALSDGRAFGTPGEGFVRINFATSRGILTEALERMAKALR